LESLPPAATHWSTRSLAKKVGLSQSAVVRIWHTFGLQPHRSETFKLSTDPLLVEKIRDIVGLYLNPPEHAVVLCVDGKSQVEALDRTQLILPLRPGLPEQRTHDYERHGKTSLFAALDIATGKVIGKCRRRHRQQEFLQFMEYVDSGLPPDAGEIHLVLDNYGTIRHPRWFVGLRAIRAIICTSPPRVGPGSIRSRGGLPRSPTSGFVAGRSTACGVWKRRSRNTCCITISTRSPSFGRRMLT
jgi:hypothetical protein